MTDRQFANVVAQICHVALAYAVTVTLAFLGVRNNLWWSAGVVLGYAIPKEFWYDYHYEDAEERGSSLEDFAFYVVGLVAGILLVKFG